MENSYREKSKKGFNNFRRVYDITMAVLFTSVGIGMFIMDRFKLNFAVEEDIWFRYFFGSICLLYGGFRLYRGFKQEEKI